VADFISLLDPETDQSGWPDDKRQRVADHLLQQVEPVDRPTVQAQLGAFILREGAFAMAGANAANMEEFWRDKAVSAPKLAKLALRFLAVAPTETSTVPGTHCLIPSPCSCLPPSHVTKGQRLQCLTYLSLSLPSHLPSFEAGTGIAKGRGK
jgi:hypothetical protein